jgi:acetyltransferase-like isoleucine patch superfamily enzyme
MNLTAKPFIHSHALCESDNVGAGTRVWAFAHILPGAVIGTNCNICDGVFIENDVTIGNDVTIKCGVQLWDGLQIGDRVFIGPNATFTNDKYPRSKVYPSSFARTFVEDGASIGANATILPGIRVGRDAMVAAGSVVTRNVAAGTTVAGNPARVIRGSATSSTTSNP